MSTVVHASKADTGDLPPRMIPVTALVQQTLYLLRFLYRRRPATQRLMRPRPILRISLIVVKADSDEHRGRCRRSRISFTGRILQVTIHTMYLNPWHILLIGIAGWMNREPVAVIEHLKE